MEKIKVFFLLRASFGPAHLKFNFEMKTYH